MFSMFSLGVQSGMHLKVGNWFVFVCVSFFVCVYVIFIISYGRVPSMGLGSRSHSCRLGSSYPIKLLK